jgi:hypothetical protein
MTKALSVVLNILLFVVVIWIADKVGNWAETFASPGNEWIYYTFALVAVILVGFPLVMSAVAKLLRR